MYKYWSDFHNCSAIGAVRFRDFGFDPGHEAVVVEEVLALGLPHDGVRGEILEADAATGHFVLVL